MMVGTEWMNRYNGSIWHRTKLLVRGLGGLVIAIPLIIMTFFLVVLEVGNRFIDTITEDDSELS